ncbi:hypothetical protein Cni_G26827 [Canna indica]|uniref:V-type proton ATPase subunit S1/VOA1 transmembrane domain-containing protein n=1 Tax=Canna indica TaxID=4628 RepID=A0AAQ3L055_9LILI|nr:hypothetical protein Cni_G26827 [Canna indica]
MKHACCYCPHKHNLFLLKLWNCYSINGFIRPSFLALQQICYAECFYFIWFMQLVIYLYCRSSEYKNKNFVDYGIVSSMDLVKSVLKGGWSNVVLQSSDISRSKQLDPSLVDILKLHLATTYLIQINTVEGLSLITFNLKSGAKYTVLYTSKPYTSVEYPARLTMRFLADSTQSNASTNSTCGGVCQIKSSLLEGIFVANLLLTILISGLCCMIGIDTPTRFEAPQES